MIKYLFGILNILFLTFNAEAQLSVENTLQLRKELLIQINELRAGKKLSTLKFDPVLEKAAAFHSNYMSKNRILRHDEKDPKNAVPKSRVINAGGNDMELVGENIIQSAPQTFPLGKEQISKLAKELFESWKKSPPHYSNMINANYVLTDFGFAVDTVNKIVYGTNLFGKRGTVIANQLSKNSFGLRMASSSCQKEFEEYSNLIYNLGNSITVVNGKVMLYLSDKELITKILTKTNDGLAVDLLERKQFPCDKENILDMSPFYDGILLKPKYKQDILGGNEAESDYRFVVSLGDVPKNLAGKELELTLVFIKNGEACYLINSGDVPSDRYNLGEVEPIVYMPEKVPFNYEGIIQSEEVKFDFRPKDSIPAKLPPLNIQHKRIHSVYIQSYSSIDGDSLSNAYYHYMRAQWIRNYVKKNTAAKDDQIKLDYKENWELMEFQMRYHFAEDLLLLPHDSIRKYYSFLEEIPWKQLFTEQRRSSATINYSAQLPPTASPIDLARLNLRTALINSQWDLANKCLAEFYQKKEFPEFILDNPYFEIIKGQPELVQNIAAIYIQNGIYDLVSETQFLFAALQLGEKLSKEAKENLAILYCKLSYDLLGVWDLPAQQLSNVIKPKEVLRVIQDVEFRPEVMANVHLTFIDYYGQINDSKRISSSFDFIADYYSKRTMNLKDEIQLCLFFNRWSKYDLTLTHLLPKFKEKKLNPEGIFLLAKTMVFYPESDPGLTNEVLRAASVNKTEWCKWLREEFQLLRDEETKKLFCKTCGY